MDLRRKSEGRDTPMILACQNGHAQLVELLADAGASVHIPDETGATPLFVASKNGHLGVVQALIARDAVVDSVAPGLQNNAPLGAAAYMGHTKVVRALLGAGADPQLKSSDNFTAEAHAKQEGHKKIADILRRGTTQFLARANHGPTGRAQVAGLGAGRSEGLPEGMPPIHSSSSDAGQAEDEPTGLDLLFSLADEQKTLQHRTELLQQVELVQGLDAELLPGLAKALVPRSFGPNEVIINVGEPADCMYFVERGTAEVIKDGRCVFTYQEGGFFGEKGLVDNAPRSASVYAGGGGVGLFRLRKDVFDAIKSRVTNALEERQEQYEEAEFGGGGSLGGSPR
eukprot:COSAG02_NODE_5188_length_4558_cov_2.133887_2_plen_341_part_00